MLLPIWELIFNISGCLPEFSKNEEIRKSALAAYHHIIAQLLLPWNQGLYCANPPRCKGWKNLYTGNLSTGVQIVQLTWLFYGSPMNVSSSVKLQTETISAVSTSGWPTNAL